jgi:hypothetical protein
MALKPIPQITDGFFGGERQPPRLIFHLAEIAVAWQVVQDAVGVEVKLLAQEFPAVDAATNRWASNWTNSQRRSSCLSSSKPSSSSMVMSCQKRAALSSCWIRYDCARLRKPVRSPQ